MKEKKTVRLSAKEAIQTALKYILKGNLPLAEQIFRKVLEVDPDNSDIIHYLGIIAYQTGDPEKAIQLFKQSIRIKDDVAEVHNNLGIVYRNNQELEKAIACYEKAIALKPEYADAIINCGYAFQLVGRLKDALSLYNRAVELEPNQAGLHNNRGSVYREMGQLEEAMADYQKSIQLKPDFAEAYTNRASIFFETGHIKKAMADYRTAVQLDPESTDALTKLASYYEKTNRLIKAEDFICRARKIAPQSPDVVLTLATVQYRKGNIDKAIELLEQMLQYEIDNVNVTFSAHFNLGKFYDRKKDTVNAFYHYEMGNKIQADCYKYAGMDENNSFLKRVKQYESYINSERRQSLTVHGDGNHGICPAFLVGFPRSGTTLLDQILDSHPKFQVMEEKEAVREVIESIRKGYPGNLDAISATEMQRLRSIYFHAADRYKPCRSDERLIDKLPLNIIHMPIVARLFPYHKIILALRHPCDVVLSNFMQNYQLNDAMASFLTMEGSVQTYGRVMSLWQKYESILPLTVHVVKYESLVDDFETEVRSLLDFLDADWNDSVCNYHLHARQKEHIKTPSYQTVTEPIYQRAKYRWKRYIQQLSPHLKMLKPFVEEFGYLDSLDRAWMEES